MIEHRLGFDELCAAIEPLLTSWVDTVVPKHVELVANNLYAPAYAWMYSYEKSLRSRMEVAFGRRLRDLERVLFGTDGVLSEGLSNAFVHGHGRRAHLPIEVWCRVGRQGVAVSIRDGGEGFDVDRALVGLNSGHGYFSFAGNGLRVLAQHPSVLASWGDGGRVLLLRVMLGEPTGGRRGWTPSRDRR